MTPEQLPSINVIDPISPAIEKVKIMLFRPFELSKWFMIGFCAWLAYLGNIGGGPNFNFSYRHEQHFQQAKNFFTENMTWIIPFIIGGVILGIVLCLVFTWLSSRGRFMFLHCVATNRAEVKVPWHSFSRHGNSLFLFRIVAGLVSLLCFVLLGGAIILLIVISTRGNVTISAPAIAGLIALSIIIIPLVIAVALLFKFTYDFVVPIMFLRTASCVDAWRRFWALLSKNLGKFIVYILFQIVITMAIGGILMAAMCITCCCAACILVIPYIGTVLMLPLLIFKRAYSLYYLRQFGPSFDCLTPEI